MALDGSGNATASVLYGPYGTTRYTTGAMPGSRGFTNQHADSTTGLDEYGARYYDAVAGQFVSADTVSDGLNRYAYVHGNPETLTDPTGHMVTCGADCQSGGGNGTPPPTNPPPPTPSCTTDSQCDPNGTTSGNTSACGGCTMQPGNTGSSGSSAAASGDAEDSPSPGQIAAGKIAFWAALGFGVFGTAALAAAGFLTAAEVTNPFLVFVLSAATAALILIGLAAVALGLEFAGASAWENSRDDWRTFETIVQTTTNTVAAIMFLISQILSVIPKPFMTGIARAIDALQPSTAGIEATGEAEAAGVATAQASFAGIAAGIAAASLVDFFALGPIAQLFLNGMTTDLFGS